VRLAAEAGPWWTTDPSAQVPAFAHLDQVLDTGAGPSSSPAYDGNGVEITDTTLVWTGTATDGSSGGGHCASWSTNSVGAQGIVGNALHGDATWKGSNTGHDCEQYYRLICFELSSSGP
jgi:hypothetical protein